MTERVLVAGVGNIFFGDDGFGVEVARRLSAFELPPGVRVEDYGVRGLHLALDLLSEPALVIIADTTARGGRPGELYVLEPDTEPAGERWAGGHGMSLDLVFRSVRTMGGEPGRVLVVGCEPETLEEGIGLGTAVSEAVEPAARLIVELASRELRGEEWSWRRFEEKRASTGPRGGSGSA